MRAIFKIVFLTIFCIVSLISCKKDDPQPMSLADRSILVYMGGDNNLAGETIDKLREMSKGWDHSINGNLLIYQDAPFNDTPRLLRITGFSEVTDMPTYEVIRQYSKQNSADPTILRSIIQEAFEAYPAKSYGLLVFSHASGWLPPHTFNAPKYGGLLSSKSVIIDGNDEMDMKDFANALPNKLFDFIIFEACNMANIEVAYELKDKTEYLIGSSAPIVSPGFTKIYKSSIRYLFEPALNLTAFADAYFNLWNSYDGLRKSATISIIKTSELDNLVNVVKDIKKSTKVEEIDINILQMFDGNVQSPFYFFDFQQYYDVLAVDESQKQLLNEAINKVVVYKRNTESYSTVYSLQYGAFPILFHSGLTSYVEQKYLPELNEDYYKLKWYNAISLN